MKLGSDFVPIFKKVTCTKKVGKRPHETSQILDMTALSGGRNTNKKRSIINFEKARLILVDNTSSYVELNTPDDFSTKCILCNKTTSHDHDIIGKLKFEPKHKSYLVSLVEKKKFQGSATSKSGSLDIIPVNNSKISPLKRGNEENPANDNDTNFQDNIIDEIDAKPSQHVYPVTVPDEATGAKYFAEELSKNSKTNAAVKVRVCSKFEYLVTPYLLIGDLF